VEYFQRVVVFFARTDAFVHVVAIARSSQVVVGGNGSVNEDKFSLSVSAPFAGDGSVTLNAKPNYRPCTYLLLCVSSSSSISVRVVVVRVCMCPRH
jgi:hypothetical protein